MRNSAKLLRGGALLALLILPGISGCAEQKPEIEYRRVKGTIQELDAQRRRLKVRFMHEKSGTYLERAGDVPTDAEIFINGRLADISELRVGEHIFVKSRLEKDADGGETRFSALRIDVTRDETVTFGGEEKGEGETGTSDGEG